MRKLTERCIDNFSVILIFLVTILSSENSAQTVTNGDTVTLGAGYVFTWIETDAQNNPMKIGLTFSVGAITNPAPGGHSVDFPSATSDTLFRHALFGYEPNGHGPAGIYSVPHFDMHFYMITEDERVQIAHGTDPVPVPESYIPQDYTTLDGMFSIFQMGVHFADTLAEELNGQPFSKTILYGFYQAKMIFVEPMITREYLLSFPDTMIAIKQPEAYQRAAYYPTNYAVKYNSTDSLYQIYLTDFILRTVTSSGENFAEGLSSYNLEQNYPNPFNPTTRISFSVPEKSTVTLKVYDILGTEVKTLLDREISPGRHEINFSAENLPAGIYFCRLKAGDYNQTIKMVILK